MAEYYRLFLAQARGQAQYRASFWFDVAASTGFGVIDLLGVLVVFHASGSLGGFTQAEGLLIAALAGAGFALADLVVGSVERIRNYVRTGLFDAVLLRPLGALGQLIAMDFAPRRAGRAVLCAALIPVTAVGAGVQWTPVRLLVAVLAPLCGAVLFGAIFVATATVAFWWIDSGEFANSFTYGGRDFSTWPATIYGGVFRRVFAYGFGFAFAGYYPALILLGRPDPLGGPPWLAWLSPLVAAVAAVVAGLFWRRGVRQYRSTGS
ncbi:transporter [Virgisporangium aliadipatigenens]|uniref:Transporter n=1 Tax=Virgisporangium aliadipatigenens TaxID=741659 RepID=A0A8J3YRS8_9ACTN|nr:ABC-2 family transporter protein [Virgisporangium aliadipatigenens]GIJ50504.1 transporter [Virgisporangium aliadipatigenens]